MAPTNLSLFPATTTSMPRKTSLRRLKTDNMPNAAGEINMKGVAFQVLSSPRTTTIEPAVDSIKHSLFCAPSLADTAPFSPETYYTSSPGSSSTQGLLPRQSRTWRQSTSFTGTPTTRTPATSHVMSPSRGEDQLSPLPDNSRFSFGSPKRSRSARPKRPPLPSAISAASQTHSTTPVEETTDKLYPLPDKTHFKPSSSLSQAEFPKSVHSASPVVSRSVEDSGYSPPVRSIFPQYDHSKPMNRQNYYPTDRATSMPAHTRDNTSKTAASSDENHTLQRSDARVGLIDRYEHVPVAAHADLQTLWKASCEEFPVSGRKVQFGLYQPSREGKSLAIGTSSEDLIYTMEREASTTTPGSNSFVVKKHCPTAARSSPVMRFTPPNRPANTRARKETKERTSIFPQAAAVNAISAVMNSQEAQHTVIYDATAQSTEAACFAQDADTLARSQYECSLVKKSRTHDLLGAVTASYGLYHPVLGHCAITVTKSIAANSATTGPRANISLHHPSATPAAVAANTLNLAFLDFAHDACVLDVPALLAFDSRYVIDTVISTLFAVAVIENDALLAESIKFEPPPKNPIKPSKAQRRASVSSTASPGLFKRSKSRKEKEVTAVSNEQVELPVIAKGTLKVMEYGFKASAWIIVAGVKVGLKVGNGAVKKITAK